MKIRAATLDDLLHEVFRRLIKSGKLTDPSKGKALEATGCVLELTNPRARMSRTEARCILFTCLGEWLWYLSGSNEFSFVQYYVPQYEPDRPGASTVRAAYGPRLKNKGRDQLKWVSELIKLKPETRRAVIPIYQPIDTYTRLPEVPCTCTLQFLLRRGRLEMLTHMRSNDAYKGLPSDVFAFTMIQEIVARSLGAEIGSYKHSVGSLHLYESDQRKAQRYLDEGWQQRLAMPIMPPGTQTANIEELLRIEYELRNGRAVPIPKKLPTYWQDLATLLKIYRADRNNAKIRELSNLRKQMHSDVYSPYIEKRQKKAQDREQIGIPDTAPELFPGGIDEER